MSNFLKFAYLFFIGSIFGWFIELLFRKYFSDVNKEKKWVNPGFCIGPYLPIYGFGLYILYLLSRLGVYMPFSSKMMNTIALIIVMGICMTLLEYIAGICLLKFMNLRLWDYSNNKWNFQGVICPFFSFGWTVLGMLYYFFIDPYILNALNWLANNLAFSFVIGMFFGVFIIDVIYSSQLIIKIRKYASENEIIVLVERLKTQILSFNEQHQKKYYFFKPLYSEKKLFEYINELKEEFESIKKVK